MLSQEQLDQAIEALKRKTQSNQAFAPLLPLIQKLHFLHSINRSIKNHNLALLMLKNLNYMCLPAHRFLMHEGEIGRQMFLMLRGKLAIVRINDSRSINHQIAEKHLQKKVYQVLEEKSKWMFDNEQAKIMLAFCHSLKHQNIPFRQYFNEKGEPQFSILTTLEETQITGELALINQSKRSASIFSLQQCQLGVLSQQSFKDIFQQCIAATKQAFQCIHGYLPYEENSQVSMLSVLCQTKVYSTSTYIWNQGDPATYFLIVRTGEIKLINNKAKYPLLTISEGCFCGDEDINTSRWGQITTRKCTVKTISNCICYIIHFKDFYNCFKKRSYIGQFFLSKARDKVAMIKRRLQIIKPQHERKREESPDSILEEKEARDLKAKMRHRVLLKPVKVEECDYFGIMDGTYKAINDLDKQIKLQERNNRWNSKKCIANPHPFSIKPNIYVSSYQSSTKQINIQNKLKGCMTVTKFN